MKCGWRIGILLLLLAASGCNWIGRQADALGEHMPVISDRCEHWQCITASGQAKSDAIKAKQPKTPTASADNVRTPAPTAPDHPINSNVFPSLQ